MVIRVLEGDARSILTILPSESVHCVVTSPPYYGLRDYGTAGQLGIESKPAKYIASMVSVFHEVRRVLRKDGTCWVNIGDSYKDKNLLGIPWMLAFALREDGWYLRSDIIWSKPNPMPESVTDRPTRAHEYLFLLTKSTHYYYDVDAIRETSVYEGPPKPGRQAAITCLGGKQTMALGSGNPAGRNKRSVWEIATAAFPEAHFATYPTALVEPCIKAGSPVGGTVLDPFVGAGTTLLVADRLQRDGIGIELNPTYAAMARKRLVGDAPMFVQIAW